MEEIWKEIDDFPMYEVSNLGRVRNRQTGLIRKPSSSTNGYLHVDFYNDGKYLGVKNIHRLVANAFLGRHDDLQVNHINGDKKDNRVENLEWCTCSENIQHSYDNCLRIPPGEKKVKIVETGQVYRSITKCADAINGDVQNVSACLLGKRSTCNGYHFAFVEKNPIRNTDFLRDYQLEACNKLFCGAILNGGVGSGKSRTGLFWYFKNQGGWIGDQEYIPMSDPKDLIIITTAMKRDTLEWEGELANFLMSKDPEKNELYSNKVVIDSWQNIKKYVDIKDSVFLFDEDRLTGNGAWVKSFYRIAKNNEWIILSATPGDDWLQYLPVFIANGFYKNKTEFVREHVQYARYTKYPKIERYYNTGRLIRLRDKILIDMDFTRHTIPHHEDIFATYDIQKYKEAIKTRWDPYKNEPIQQASGLCYILRRIVNEDDSRQAALLELFEKHPKMIIFYNFDYELDILKGLYYGENVAISEWNGHSHQPVPDTKSWVYLVQYTAGCEGWNCIKTDTIVFYSQNYSYKVVTQAAGRIDRLNTPFRDLYYYRIRSRSGIDVAIYKALKDKKQFNERRFVKWDKPI